MSIEDMTVYQREWYHAKRQGDPEYAAKRKARRLANYEKVRAQEKASRAKNIEKHRASSRERMKEYRQTDRYKELKPGQDMKRKYGLTRDDWSTMFLAQGSACAICKTTEKGTRRWHIDHCHETGKTRGILCQHCNLMLGHARDSPATLAAAIEYLVHHCNPKR